MRTLLHAVPAALILAVTTSPACAAIFDPMRFFDGRTEGDGRVKVVLKGTHGVKVHGRGRLEPDGTLVLDQTVEEEGEKPRQRSWRMRQTAPGKYTGTITDAAGPVVGELVGGRFHLRFRMKEGNMAVEQWLTPTPDGTTLHNSMTIKKFGFTVATLEETIRAIR